MTSNKKVLLVGDFRNCVNYGAIGTTEQLLKMIMSKVSDENIRTIEYRSFTAPTPKNGWADDYMECRKREIHGRSFYHKIYRKIVKNKVFQVYLLDILNTIRLQRSRRKKSESHVPLLWKFYEAHLEDMKNDKILQYEKNLLQWADIVLINAEGSIVKGIDEHGIHRKCALYSLFMAYAAKVGFDKKCYVINHTVDPQNMDVIEMIQNVYPRMDGIYVREPLSKELLEKYGIKNAKYVPDALFAYDLPKGFKVSNDLKEKIDFTKPYICVGDSSALKAVGLDIRWDVKVYYTKLIEKLKTACPQIVFIDGYTECNPDINYVVKKTGVIRVSIKDTNCDELFWVLKNSKVFLSGRWHTSILALCAGTPIILWGSDSHKTMALYAMLESEEKCWDIRTLPLHIDEIVERAKDVINNEQNCDEKLILQLRNKAWDNVDML